VLGASAVVAVGEEEDQAWKGREGGREGGRGQRLRRKGGREGGLHLTCLPKPFGLAAGNKSVNDGLRAVGEIAELSFP